MITLGALSIARAWCLPLAVMAAVLVGWWVLARARGRRARLARLGDAAVLERLVPAVPTLLGPRLRSLLLGAATLLLGIALAGPRWGERPLTQRSLGADVAFVIDVSTSMLAPDETPSRLAAVQADLRRLLTATPGLRAAILAVAGRSYILTPLTPDHDALSLFLDDLDPSMVSQGGTALAAGIAQASQLLGATAGEGDRAIVVLSDGESWDGMETITKAAADARAAGIAVLAVQYGQAAGSRIPGRDGGGVKRDERGAPVITRADPATLSAIAAAGGGTFIPADAGRRADALRRAVQQLRMSEGARAIVRHPTERAALFLWPALVLLVMEALLADRPRRRGAPLATMVLVLWMVHAPAVAAQGPVSDSTRNAVARLRAARAAARAVGTPRALYNLGSAQLAADSLPDAIESLGRVAESGADRETRFRALFNLGLAHIRMARRAGQGSGADQAWGAAMGAYKRALRVRDDDDARWNLELATRERQQSSGGGGGSGGGSPPPPSAPPKAPADNALDKQRAEAVLNSAARDERDVQGRRERDRPRREPATGRDW